MIKCRLQNADFLDGYRSVASTFGLPHRNNNPICFLVMVIVVSIMAALLLPACQETAFAVQQTHATNSGASLLL